MIGVMPPGVQHVGGNYRSVGQGDTVEIWWALPLWPAKTDGCDRRCHYLNMIARLERGFCPIAGAKMLQARNPAGPFPSAPPWPCLESGKEVRCG